MKKEQDWTGNKKTTFATLGASNHTDHERADHDYYATEPLAADLICSVEKFEGGIWENCCVDCDTEYFNGVEWKKISEYRSEDKVLSFDGQNGVLLTPIKYHKICSDEELYYYHSFNLNMMVTKNHRMVYKHRRSNKLMIDSADNVFKSYKTDSNGFRGKIPTTFKYDGEIELDEWYLRLAVACNADGRTRTKNKKTYQCRFKKERKIQRMKYLLERSGIQYSYREYNGYADFIFESPYGCKQFPIEWINLNNYCKQVIIDEICYWDGNINEDNIKCFFTSKKRDADIIQFIAHSIGIGTHVYEDKRREKTNYRIMFKSKGSHALSKHKNNLDMMKSADGYVYCFSVDTGMLILRRNNFIFITGNCGQGHLSKRFKELGYNVVDTDLIDRGYGVGGVDFFECDKALAPNIVTNPPYKYAKEWVEHSLELLDEGNKLALFLPIQFLESDSRRGLFATTPPETVYVCVNRILCGMNGDFNAKDKDGNTIYNKDGSPKKMSSAKCYAWFVWRKGYVGDTTIKWIN